jgi:hypothetical protein
MFRQDDQLIANRINPIQIMDKRAMDKIYKNDLENKYRRQKIHRLSTRQAAFVSALYWSIQLTNDDKHRCHIFFKGKITKEKEKCLTIISIDYC